MPKNHNDMVAALGSRRQHFAGDDVLQRLRELREAREREEREPVFRDDPEPVSQFMPGPETEQALYDANVDPGYGMNWLQRASLPLSAFPVVGDVAGLAGDAQMYYENPESRNWMNYVLSAAGALPFVPSAAGAVKNRAARLEKAAKSKKAAKAGAAKHRAAQLKKAAKSNKMGQGGGRKGNVAKERVTTFPGRQRVAYPGVYGDPKAIALAAPVEPESAALSELFGVTRTDLAQLSERGSTLPDWQPPATAAKPKGSAVADKIMTKGNERRLVNLLAAAKEYNFPLYEGSVGWYVMDPLYLRFIEELGPKEGARRFIRSQSLGGMASPGASPVTEINRGSRAAFLDHQGRFAEFERMGGVGSNFAKDPDVWGLMGHPYHSTSQAAPMRKYIDEGKMPASAKVPSYIQAHMPPHEGVQTHYPVGDAHWARGVGLADVRTNKGYAQSATLPEMTALAPWYRTNVAAEAGLEAVPAQALQWGLLGPQTGVKLQDASGYGAGKLEMTANAIVKRAGELGISPKDMLKRYINDMKPIGAITVEMAVALAAATGVSVAAVKAMMDD